MIVSLLVGYKRVIGWKTPVVWQDEQVVVFDCFSRLSGYNYMAIIDIDEFIRPVHNHNLPDMMVSAHTYFIFSHVRYYTCPAIALEIPVPAMSVISSSYCLSMQYNVYFYT